MKTGIKIYESQFLTDITDENNIFNYNGKQMNKGLYNLVSSIFAVSLYNKGIKPNRFFKITGLKNYYGFKGNNNAFELYLREVKDFITEQKNIDEI